jgi:hypothetical protein
VTASVVIPPLPSSELAIVGRRADASFLRTSDGHEIDLLLSMGRERWAVEVKLTSAPDPHDLERLDRAANLVRASKRIVVSQTPRPIFSDRRISCDLASLLTFLRDGA